VDAWEMSGLKGLELEFAELKRMSGAFPLLPSSEKQDGPRQPTAELKFAEEREVPADQE